MCIMSFYSKVGAAAAVWGGEGLAIKCIFLPAPLPSGSPLVKVVVVLRPLDVDELLVLLLVSFPTRDGEVLHVPQSLP